MVSEHHKTTVTGETAPFLQGPTDEYLSIIFSMFFRDGRDNRVVEHSLLSPNERTVRLHDDIVLLTKIHDSSLLTKRMKLTRVNEHGMSGWSGSTDGFTWIWFTAGGSNPASVISLRW